MVSGTLICPLRLSAPTAFAYYHLGLPDAASSPKIVRFRDWLQAQAAAMPSELEPGDSPSLDLSTAATPGIDPDPLEDVAQADIRGS
jgi:hypothetical protein